MAAWPDLTADTKAVEEVKRRLGPDAMTTPEGRALAQELKRQELAQQLRDISEPEDEMERRTR